MGLLFFPAFVIDLSRSRLFGRGFLKIGFIAFSRAEIFVVAVIAPDLLDRFVAASAVAEPFFLILFFFSHIVLFLRLKSVFSYEFLQVSFVLQV